jgi:hypothetical protein
MEERVILAVRTAEVFVHPMPRNAHQTGVEVEGRNVCNDRPIDVVREQ